MLKYILIFICAVTPVHLLSVGNISQYQYWIDNNISGKNTVQINAPNDTVSVNFSINILNLPAGPHLLSLRFKDDSSWSGPLSKYFIKLPKYDNMGVVSNINSYEYWFDELVNFTVVPINPNDTSIVNFSFDVSTFSTGLHKFNMRFKNELGIYSTTYCKYFIKLPYNNVGNTANRITSYEYWYDDFHTSKQISPINPTDTASVFINFIAGDLPNGAHRFNLRFKDEFNNYSSVMTKYFIKFPISMPTSQNRIVSYRYWFNSNISSMMSIDLQDQPDTLNLLRFIAVPAMAQDSITITTQFMDNEGNWSAPQSQIFKNQNVVYSLSAPVLLTPADSSVWNSFYIYFAWSSVENAELYNFQISDTSDFSSLVLDTAGLPNTFQGLFSHQFVPGKTYFWRVKATASAPLESDWSEIRTFSMMKLSAPDLALPADSSADQLLITQFLWYGSMGATYYDLHISKSPSFIDTVYYIQDIYSNSYYPNSLEYSTQYYWRVRARNYHDTSNWSTPWTFSTEIGNVTQSITLTNGWNMISGNVTPENPAMSSVTARLSGNMQLIKNAFGQIYAPPFQNSLSLWDSSQAYMLRLSQGAILLLSGLRIKPENASIALNSAGTFWIPYNRTSSMTTATALATISGKYMQVKSIQGQVYQPPFFNTLPQLQPGAGYIIRMIQSGTLTYPANDVTKSSANDAVFHKAKVFVQDNKVTGKTAVVAMDIQNIADGDEIGVFTQDGMLVGSSVWQEGNRGVVVRGDDDFTSEKDGAVEGEELSVKIWSSSEKRFGKVVPIKLTNMTNNADIFNLTYETDAVDLLKGAAEFVKEAKLLITPQPASNEVFVEIPYWENIELQKPSIDVKLYNQAGQLALGVEDVTNDKVIKLNTSNLSSGVYQLILNIDGKAYSEKLVIIK